MRQQKDAVGLDASPLNVRSLETKHWTLSSGRRPAGERQKAGKHVGMFVCCINDLTVGVGCKSDGGSN